MFNSYTLARHWVRITYLDIIDTDTDYSYMYRIILVKQFLLKALVYLGCFNERHLILFYNIYLNTNIYSYI